jgi:hypothetical protein
MTERMFTVIDDGRVIETAEREGIELARRAQASGRPVAVDLDERTAYLGVAARERAAALASLEAPDFTLPDLGGRSIRSRRIAARRCSSSPTGPGEGVVWTCRSGRRYTRSFAGMASR